MKVEIKEEDLYRLYVTEGKSAEKIGKMYGCTKQSVFNKLHKYEIKVDLRKRKEAGKDVMENQDGTINCNMRGNKCIYKNKGGVYLRGTCNYAVNTGKLRGCDPEHCDKYKI